MAGEIFGSLSSSADDNRSNPSHLSSLAFPAEDEVHLVTDIHGNDSVINHSSDDLFSDYPVALTDAAAICCIIFILLGIPGNLITIIALARCKKVIKRQSYYSL